MKYFQILAGRIGFEPISSESESDILTIIRTAYMALLVGLEPTAS